MRKYLQKCIINNCKWQMAFITWNIGRSCDWAVHRKRCWMQSTRCRWVCPGKCETSQSKSKWSPRRRWADRPTSGRTDARRWCGVRALVPRQFPSRELSASARECAPGRWLCTAVRSVGRSILLGSLTPTTKDVLVHRDNQHHRHKNLCPLQQTTKCYVSTVVIILTRLVCRLTRLVVERNLNHGLVLLGNQDTEIERRIIAKE